MLVGLVGLLLAMGPVAYLAILPDQEDEVVDLTENQIGYLAEEGGAFAFPEVRAREKEFVQMSLREAGELPRKPYWLRLPLANPASKRLVSVLEIYDLYVDNIEVYEADGAAPLRTGQEIALRDRGVRSHLPAVPIVIEPESETTLWIRSAGIFDAPPPLRLWASSEEFRRYEQRQVLALTLYFGLWGALFIYNLFVFAVLRERTVLWYLAYLFPFGALIAVGTNFGVNFFPAPSGIFREALLFALLMASCFTMLQFSRAFLETKRQSPRADLLLRGLAWATGLALLFSPFLLRIEVIMQAWKIYYPLVLVVVIVAPGVGVYLWIKRCRQAPLYVLAFACIGVAFTWMILAQLQLGILPADQTNGAPFIIGSAMEILLLAIAVAFRYRLIRDEKEALQANYATQLSQEVEERTRELLALSQSLTQSNADKDRLITIIAHDVRAPLASMLAVYRMLPADQLAQHASQIQRRCADLLELVNNLLEWARLRTGQLMREQATLNLLGLVDGALRSLRMAARQKAVNLVVEVPADIELFADGHAVQSILRNLAGNAVKYTESGGTVTLRAVREAGRAIVSVRDTGIGMDAEQLARLRIRMNAASAPGTLGETGAGVGLTLVGELIERENGSLAIDSEVGKGTTVTVTLPLAAP